ncbi:MAG TPA: hypothetical protein PLW65_05575 [Pseudomonadota bacterium]|nr:hypothetical protein [Pseudomonadota bacterium]
MSELINNGAGFQQWLTPQPPTLQEFLKLHRTELVARVRSRLAARAVPGADDEELAQAVTRLVDQLAAALGRRARSSQPGPGATDDLASTAARQGSELLHKGFTLAQVVHYYGDLNQAVTELAVELKLPVDPGELHTLNICLEEAIAEAVSAYGQVQEQLHWDAEVQRLGGLAHELRNLLTSATLAYDVLKNGQVGIDGSAGMILGRSLKSLRGLIDRSLSEACVPPSSRESSRLCRAH